jgi:hypothetical protein
VSALVSAVLPLPLFPAIKQILAWSDIDCGACLPPRGRLDHRQQDVLRAGLVAAGFGELAGRG